MIQRIRTGHVLPESPEREKEDPLAEVATRALMDALEERCHCILPQSEREEIYEIVAAGHIIHSNELNASVSCQVFQPQVLEMVDQFLTLLQEQFHLDLGADTDFYITLLQLIRALQFPIRIFKTDAPPDRKKEQLLTELELAWLFQGISMEFAHRYLTQAELIHLADCLSGALGYLYVHQSEQRVRCVICCHTHLTAAWTMKRRILARFGGQIEVTDRIPVNVKDSFSFEKTDLVLSTVKKPITNQKDTTTIVVSPQFTTADLGAIEDYLLRRRMDTLYPVEGESFEKLLEDAWWQTDAEPNDLMRILNQMGERYVREGIAPEAWKTDLLRRESVCPHAVSSGVLFVPSLGEAKRTQLSVAVPSAHLWVKKHRIWAVLVAAFHPKDRMLAFHLLQMIHKKNQLMDKPGGEVTKERLSHWLCSP